jgi:hypothetical protein
MRCLRLATVCSTGLLSAFILPAPASALRWAACTTWAIPAKMYLSQSNLAEVYIEGGLQGKAKKGKVGQLTFGGLDHENYGTDFTGVLDGYLDQDRVSVSFTIHWLDPSYYSTGVYTGEIGPTGSLQGTTFDKEHPETTARWFLEGRLECATPSSTAQLKAEPASPPPVALGRTPVAPGSAPNPPQTICEEARSARARNSPVAPMLEARCAAERSKNLTAKPEKLEINPSKHLEVVPH